MQDFRNFSTHSDRPNILIPEFRPCLASCKRQLNSRKSYLFFSSSLKIHLRQILEVGGILFCFVSVQEICFQPSLGCQNFLQLCGNLYKSPLKLIWIFIFTLLEAIPFFSWVFAPGGLTINRSKWTPTIHTHFRRSNLFIPLQVCIHLSLRVDLHEIPPLTCHCRHCCKRDQLKGRLLGLITSHIPLGL